MKKIKSFLFMFLLCIGSLLAQTPGAFNYQAVLRNNEGQIMNNQDVSIRINIVKQSATGDIVFQEKHLTTTNEFGIIVLEIGNGTPAIGTITDINWGENTYFLKVELDATGGESYVEIGTSQMLSVPYALYAKSSGSSFSGKYSDLEGKPELPIDISELNDAGNLLFDGDYNSLTNKPDLSQLSFENTDGWDKDVADDFDGDYNSLINKPTTISAAQATAIENNTAKISNVKADWDATTGEAQILNKPDLTVYVEDANTMAWDKNAADDFDGDFNSLSNVPANLDTDATDDFSGSFSDLTDVPTNLDTDSSDDFDGDYNNLTNKPTTISAAQATAIENNTAKISNVKADWDATTGEAQILNKPDLTVYVEDANTTNWDKDASDDFDGEYSSLNNAPTTITTAQASAIEANTLKTSNVQANWSAISGEAQILNKPDLTVYVEEDNTSSWDKNAADDFSGNFDDLTDVPVNLDTDSTDDFDGNYNSLINKPTTISVAQATAIDANTAKISNVKADWNAVTGEAQILNKPDLSDIHSHDGSADYTFIGTANDNTVTQNTATGEYATVTGGENNSASGQNSTIAGGKSNIASGGRSVVSGGASNRATNPQATVSGGEGNTASGNTSTVSGGAINTASNYYTTVGGGYNNTASGNYSTIPGGVENQTMGEFSTAMGYQNYAKSYGETALGYFSTDYTALSTTGANPNDRLFVIGNGSASSRSDALVMYKNGNTSLNGELTINNGTGTAYTLPADNGTDGQVLTTNGAGVTNWVAGFDGDYNSLTNKPTTITTAQADAIVANTAKISNVKADWNAATGEAQILNKPDLSDIHSHDGSADYTFIGTANDNTVTPNTATGEYATVTGGENNSASGQNSTIAGGKSNIASGGRSVVSGGASNKATDSQATVSGGEGNTASGNTSTVSGGALNTASSYYTTVGGGFDNMASGHYSTIPGGVENQTMGEFSTAMGYQNYAKSYGETALGYFSTDYTALSTTGANPNDRLFVIGNGSASSRSDALVMYKNGNTTLNGDLTVNGTIKSSVFSTTTAYTITDTDGYSIILSDGANIVLPDPPSNVNRVITIKNKHSSATISVTTSIESYAIDNNGGVSHPLELTSYSSAKLVSDGSHWWIIGN
ncbi:hypothetical protein [Draconibacterium halophilum]|uniref:Trimeric autotransporter adhesin YadA-like head domain-containing protein n=1 Tax=Draconibacterium halophilum TaxID=2706887 RepID=A0A6C0RGZ5_9BACT|nr:hypothetical protein [Draconibacterium halophilum]QIA09266.1 hypothetical protein G0Q07_16795 [Draconibacterium halophilum]